MKSNKKCFVSQKNNRGLFGFNAGLLLLFTFFYLNTASAALMIYNDRSLFNLDAPGLPVETFENHSAISDPITFAPPLDENTNNGTFTPGDILPGISISVLQETGGTGDVILEQSGGVIDPPSSVIGPNAIPDALEITFSIPVNAVGFDLIEFANTTNLITIAFYNNLTLLGDLEVNPTRIAMFVGAISDTDEITRITTSFGNVGEAIDNIAFGLSSSEPEPSAVPLPGSLSFFLFGLMIMLRNRKFSTSTALTK